jgi:hypothetical protein
VLQNRQEDRQALPSTAGAGEAEVEDSPKLQSVKGVKSAEARWHRPSSGHRPANGHVMAFKSSSAFSSASAASSSTAGRSGNGREEETTTRALDVLLEWEALCSDGKMRKQFSKKFIDELAALGSKYGAPGASLVKLCDVVVHRKVRVGEKGSEFIGEPVLAGWPYMLDSVEEELRKGNGLCAATARESAGARS